MNAPDGGPASPPPPKKRPYVPPYLERLGSIRDLTTAQGMSGSMDNEHPPGQNKSIGP
jgi:hypothetical protein